MSKLTLPFPLISPIPLIFLLLILPFHVISQSPDTELKILLKLREQLGNPPSIQSWNSSSSPCDWPEIKCNQNNSVTGIILRDINITVTIPATVCDIENLSELNLAYNYIPGEFPKTLYACSNLKILDLSQNYFVGPIPADVDKLSAKLTYIDVGANNFSGDIPAAIGQLRELRTLYLYQNLFDGTYPDEIGDLSNLEDLALAYNSKFTAAIIPESFGKLKKLRRLWMTKTNSIGELPESIGNCTSLEHLDLSLNNLTGKIPASLFLLKNLSIIYLYHNKFSGQIPTKVEALNLVDMDLSRNNLTGSIPVEIGKLRSLKSIHLFNNELSGEVPVNIGLIPSLTDIKLFSNRLSGVLPPSIGLHSKLEAFEVGTNFFTGKLPENLCAGGALVGVTAFSNNLTGEVPKSLGSCPSLRTIQLYGNNFSGDLPPGIWTLFNLSSLMISDNSLEGELPRDLSWNLSRVEISNNKFSGEIPVEIANWKSLVVLEASNNEFSGEIPEEMTSLSHINTILLDGNQFSGNLPFKIVAWRSLTSLNLARNNLSGEIPLALGSLPSLNYLDLSENQFSGKIPDEIGRLRLTSLNFSSNQLSGKIPHEFENLAYDASFLNNSKLCTDTPDLGISLCTNPSSGSKKISSKFLAIVLVLAIAVFLATVLLTLFVIRDFRRKKHERDLATWKLTSFQRLEFTQVNILSSLSEKNLIGSGGSGKVYKVNIGRNDEFVAVKRICSSKKLDENLEKEFIAEVEILGTIRHANIVKLLCCISSDNSKLLVYEYLENHSLDRWLHKKKRTTSLCNGSSVCNVGLDWPTRLQIAIGAAHGLCYMHHDCSPSIVHRDVKSSNILLDSTFKARIADFGLAKMLVKQGEADTMSTVAGSYGYFAPEYAYTTKVNEKIDVYSFGVVLLELATGREAGEGGEHTCLAEWAWKQYADEKNIANAIDEEIKEACYLEEMITLFKLGLVCTNTTPSLRPSMKEVVQVLRRCCPIEEEVEGKKKVIKSEYDAVIKSEYDAAPLLDSPRYVSSYKKGSKRVSDEDDDSLIRIV